VSADTLLRLIRETGPAFARKSRNIADARAGKSIDSTNAAAWLLQRIEATAAHSPLLRQRWAADWAGLDGASRSGKACAVMRALKRAGFSFNEARQATLLHCDPDVPAWMRDKGEAHGCREAQRIWDLPLHAGSTASDFDV